MFLRPNNSGYHLTTFIISKFLLFVADNVSECNALCNMRSALATALYYVQEWNK